MSLKSLIASLKQRFLNPTDEELLGNLFIMLKDKELSPNLGLALDTLINDTFKLDIEVIEPPMQEFHDWFNSTIYRIPNIKWEIVDSKYRTCSRENLKLILERDWVDRRKYIAEWFDCVTEDTPLIIKRRGELPEVVEAGEIAINSFPTPIKNVSILSPNGLFTPIGKAQRKTTTKPIIRLLHDCEIGLTADHKVVEFHKGFGGSAHLVKAEELSRINPNWNCQWFFKPLTLGNKELGFAYGLFMADGTASESYKGKIHRYNWAISSQDRNLLERSQKALAQKYPHLEFKICSFPSNSRVTNYGERKSPLLNLEVISHRKYGKRKEFVQFFSKSFYTSTRRKKVPSFILNGISPLKEGFYEGVLAGDGDARSRITCPSKIETFGLSLIMKQLGLMPSVKDCGKGFSIIYPSSWAPKLRLKAETKEREVVDLSTGSGYFMAGTFPVKNCEDFATLLRARLITVYGINACAIVHARTPDYAHGYNCFWHGGMEWSGIEPQTDAVWDYTGLVTSPIYKPENFYWVKI